MSLLLERPPYGPRDPAALVAELGILTRHHLDGCPAYARIWPDWRGADRLADLPYLHVGLFKRIDLRTTAPGITFQRTLKSSSTTGRDASLIALDERSSQLQGRSVSLILADFLGSRRRPLLVLDSSKSLLARGEVSARLAAAMSLRPLASNVVFLLDDAEDPSSLNWNRLASALEAETEAIVYGFTWMLWQAWVGRAMPDSISRLLAGRSIRFVHSGGWKKLEALRVDRADFDARLLAGVGPASSVLDFYGLVEQVGVVYPECAHGFRHVPVWADLLVRDPYSLRPAAEGESGLLQLLNVLPWGSPYHSVLTEDIGRIAAGPCPCGRSGSRFELLGRVPKAEIRGCGNV